MPYSVPSDMLVGSVTLSRGLEPQKYVDDAADEIDSSIGFIYVTPVDIESDGNPVVRPARLLLKRLNNNLATGRYIMAMTASGQRLELHAYGAQLVKEVIEILKQIAAGDILLEGAPKIDDGEGNANFTGPQIANLDAESNVESFYNRVGNPGYCFAPMYGPGNNDTGLIVGG